MGSPKRGFNNPLLSTLEEVQNSMYQPRRKKGQAIIDPKYTLEDEEEVKRRDRIWPSEVYGWATKAPNRRKIFGNNGCCKRVYNVEFARVFYDEAHCSKAPETIPMMLLRDMQVPIFFVTGSATRLSAAELMGFVSCLQTKELTYVDEGGHRVWPTHELKHIKERQAKLVTARDEASAAQEAWEKRYQDLDPVKVADDDDGDDPRCISLIYTNKQVKRAKDLVKKRNLFESWCKKAARRQADLLGPLMIARNAESTMWNQKLLKIPVGLEVDIKLPWKDRAVEESFQKFLKGQTLGIAKSMLGGQQGAMRNEKSALEKWRMSRIASSLPALTWLAPFTPSSERSPRPETQDGKEQSSKEDIGIAYQWTLDDIKDWRKGFKRNIDQEGQCKQLPTPHPQCPFNHHLDEIIRSSGKLQWLEKFLTGPRRKVPKGDINATIDEVREKHGPKPGEPWTAEEREDSQSSQVIIYSANPVTLYVIELVGPFPWNKKFA
jgi:hypothetical protein